MNENMTTIRIELDVAAKRIISQVMMENEHLNQEIEAGVRASIEKFDFKGVVEAQITRCIEGAIKESSDWGLIRKKTKEAVEAITGEFIQRQVDAWKKEMNL